MTFRRLKSYFTNSASGQLLAKLRDIHCAIFSAERRRQREARELHQQIAEHELAITEYRLAIAWREQASRCLREELDVLGDSRGNQIEALRNDERAVLNELNGAPADREAVAMRRIEVMEGGR